MIIYADDASPCVSAHHLFRGIVARGRGAAPESHRGAARHRTALADPGNSEPGPGAVNFGSARVTRPRRDPARAREGKEKRGGWGAALSERRDRESGGGESRPESRAPGSG